MDPNKFKKIKDFEWEIPKSGAMLVPGRIFASEKLIEWAFFYLADQVVKTTKTPHDDKFLEEVKKAYQDGTKGQ